MILCLLRRVIWGYGLKFILFGQISIFFLSTYRFFSKCCMEHRNPSDLLNILKLKQVLPFTDTFPHCFHFAATPNHGEFGLAASYLSKAKATPFDHPIFLQKATISSKK
mmetsp:Transcript_11055/g.16248  ORF Transcript_11055/g.16248 Transcript_11055/m.16248 type:complete len:109 (+) Transcript_11055:175-501(+)